MPSIPHELSDRIVAGDAQAVAELLELLRPRLTAMADRLLWGRPGGDYGAEDAVQSAVRTFFRRAGQGKRLDVEDVEGLPGLLATITCRKALKQIRRRGKVVDEAAIAASDETADSPRPLDRIATVIPEQEFDLLCEELFQALPDDTLRSIALMTLHGYDQSETAAAHGFTSRNVRYKLDKIRRIWSEKLKGSQHAR
jgi:DNA-directed RNA polymerase specialized sigma24 family protein